MNARTQENDDRHDLSSVAVALQQLTINSASPAQPEADLAPPALMRRMTELGTDEYLRKVANGLYGKALSDFSSQKIDVAQAINQFNNALEQLNFIKNKTPSDNAQITMIASNITHLNQLLLSSQGAVSSYRCTT